MVKCLLSFLFIFLTLPSFSFAKVTEASLQAEFGHDLTKVPFFLRFAYNKELDKEWGKTNYSERKSFLMEYETNLANNQAKEKVEARLEAQQEKERVNEKRQEDREEKDRLRAQEAEDKAEELEDAERQKEFDQSVRDQQKELDEMEKQAAQGGR